jgi:hypothetical protein
MMRLEDWSSTESGEDLAVVVSGIRQRVAEQVVGLKLIGLFQKEKYWVLSWIVYFSLLMMCQLFGGCCKTSLL